MPFFQGLRLVMSHGPYVKLIAGFLFTSLAFMVSGGLRCSSQEYIYGVGVKKIGAGVKLRGRQAGGANRGLWNPQVTFFFFFSFPCPSW